MAVLHGCPAWLCCDRARTMNHKQLRAAHIKPSYILQRPFRVLVLNSECIFAPWVVIGLASHKKEITTSHHQKKKVQFMSSFNHVLRGVPERSCTSNPVTKSCWWITRVNSWWCAKNTPTSSALRQFLLRGSKENGLSVLPMWIFSGCCFHTPHTMLSRDLSKIPKPFWMVI